MELEAQSAFVRLQALAERDAGRADPVRFRFLQAMARRAEGYDGEARRVLDAKMGALLDAYEQALQERGTGQAGESRSHPESCTPQETSRDASRDPEMPSASDANVSGQGPLATLLASLSERHAGREDARIAAGLAPRADYPELGMLDAAQATWLRLSTDRQLRDSEKRIPDNAGPLNSSQLVHRALMLMKELSPEYLRQFLSYVNALAWMEQMTDGNAASPEAAPRAGGQKKPSRGRKR